MSVLATSAVRSRVATAIGLLAGWRQSRYAPPIFGMDTGGAGGRLHHSFSVEAQGCFASPAPVSQRQRLGDGVRVSTSIVVRFAHRLRADNQVSDYDSGLDAVETIITTVMGISQANLHIVLDRVQPPGIAPAGDYFLAELRFTAEHRLALQ